MHPMTYVRRIRGSGLPHTARLVALALAARADNDQGHCWPSVARLAADTGLHRATVYRALAVLEAAGWILRFRRFEAGAQRSNVYVLTAPAAVEEPRPAAVDNPRGGVAQRDGGGRTARSTGGRTVRHRTRTQRTTYGDTARAVDNRTPVGALLAELGRAHSLPT